MVVDRDFDALFRSQFPRLVALGIAMAGSVDVASDLAQETMARAHRHWATVSAVDSPEAWLRRVMTNLLIDHHRRTQVETVAIQRLARRPIAGPDAPPEYRFAELLGVLTERQRAAVALFYVEDLPIAEIAEALDIAPGTVKALLWKARRTLTRHISRETS